VEFEVFGDGRVDDLQTAEELLLTVAAVVVLGDDRAGGADTVGDVLREEGFSLQASAKTLEGRQHPDRDAQFRYINEQARGHMGADQPVISVDTKKKELVGDYKNAGRQ
jgi:hypothetical protein